VNIRRDIEKREITRHAFVPVDLSFFYFIAKDVFLPSAMMAKADQAGPVSL
jgi:hypothetical protein